MMTTRQGMPVGILSQSERFINIYLLKFFLKSESVLIARRSICHLRPTLATVCSGTNEALAFFVNDISSNPIAKENAIDANFRIKMIRFELALIDRTRFIYLKRFYKCFIKPIFAGLSIVLKYVLVIPFGRLIAKLFPKFAQRVQTKHSKDK